MKDFRTRSLSVKLGDDEENDLNEVVEHLHHTKGLPNTKTAAIRHLIERAHNQMCEEIISSSEE